MLLEQLREELGVARGRKQEMGPLFSSPQSHKVVDWLFFFFFFFCKERICLFSFLTTTADRTPRMAQGLDSRKPLFTKT